MAIKNKKVFRRERIKKRIRKVITGSAIRPRLTVFRSNKDIYAQLIDDDKAVTLVAASSLVSDITGVKIAKIEKAKLVGKLIAQKAIEAGVSEVIFDRNGYLYHGRVKALAEAARENGLKF